MSIVVRFNPAGMTKAQYDETVSRLEAGGSFPADGLSLHLLFGTDGDLKVSEVWDSQEQFEAFGPVLMPILEDVGIQFSGPPEVFPVRNEIRG